MKANMMDVAKQAGVSVATVSHVINETRYVSPETEKKVKESIKLLGYYPDIHARGFKTGRKHLIGIIIPDIANPFYSCIIEKAEQALSRQNYKLIIANSNEDRAREIENLKLFSYGLVDGILLASTLDSHIEIAENVRKDFPIVLINRKLSGTYYDSIFVNTYDATYEGVSKILSNGHTRIGFIGGLERFSTTKERVKAYKDALESKAIPINDSLIHFVDCYSNNYDAINNLLEQGCTAFVLANSYNTDDMIKYLSENDLFFKHNISILGHFEKLKLLANKIGWYSIIKPSAEIGKNAALQILERLNSPNAGSKMVSFNANLF